MKRPSAPKKGDQSTTASEVLGERLRVLRTRAGLTMTKAAERTGFSASYIFQLEHGQHAPPRETLIKFANTYNHPLDDLLRVAGLLDPREDILPINAVRWAFAAIGLDPRLSDAGLALQLGKVTDVEAMAVAIELYSSRTHLVLLEPEERAVLWQWLGLSIEEQQEFAALCRFKDQHEASEPYQIPEKLMLLLEKIRETLRTRDVADETWTQITTVVASLRQWNPQRWHPTRLVPEVQVDMAIQELSLPTILAEAQKMLTFSEYEKLSEGERSQREQELLSRLTTDLSEAEKARVEEQYWHERRWRDQIHAQKAAEEKAWIETASQLLRGTLDDESSGVPPRSMNPLAPPDRSLASELRRDKVEREAPHGEVSTSSTSSPTDSQVLLEAISRQLSGLQERMENVENLLKSSSRNPSL